MSEEENLPDHLVRLNPAQYRAVTSLEGPLLILAGAGSGKTRVLTRRIAHLLHKGVSPDNILAVTFTNKAASEMKERVEELVGEAGKKVWVSTFHSTCCRILRMDIEAIGYTKRFAIYDDEDQLRIVRDLLANAGYDKDRVEARAIRGQIDHYKNRMMTVDDVVATKRDHPNSPLVLIWREYDEALQAADALDFNDLIGTTVRLFKEHPAILSKWRERFQYVMVDEYQDTNRGQYELLHLLAGEHRNLAVVGDDDQSIYGFRGADISIILSFEHDNPDATVVKLEQNYRSSSNILDVANSVVAKNEGRLDKKLWTQAPEGPRVELALYADTNDEAKATARRILQLRRSGISFEDVAVIYRTNAMSRPLEAAFSRAGIAHRIVGGRKLYDKREVRDILGYLRILVNVNDDAAFLRVVNVPRRGIGAKTLAALREEASDRGSPLLLTARSGRIGKVHAGMAAFVKLIDEFSERAKDDAPHELVSALISESGYDEMLRADTDKNDKLTRDASTRLENLQEFANQAESFPRPEGAWTNVEHLTAWLDTITLASDTDDIPEGGMVTMMTVHSSKGLEYPVVFVTQMNDGRFPHERSKETGLDEERRLAYVAFTRAMKLLVISRTKTAPAYSPEKREGKVSAPSPFIFGLPEESVVGQRPEGEPAEDKSKARFRGAKGEKLAAFISNRAPPKPPQGELMFLAFESLDEVEPGTKITWDRIHICEVLKREQTKVTVRLPTGRFKEIDLGRVSIERVVER